jgi:hypothetical protein
VKDAVYELDIPFCAGQYTTLEEARAQAKTLVGTEVKEIRVELWKEQLPREEVLQLFHPETGEEIPQAALATGGDDDRRTTGRD